MTSLRSGDLSLSPKSWREAQQVYDAALAVDPADAQAHLGLCRVALHRKKFHAAAKSALDALQNSYHDPTAQYLLGLALTGLKLYRRAADALRDAISFDPNFPEAHVRLAAILERHLGDPESAHEHRMMARRMRRRNFLGQDPHPVQEGVAAIPNFPRAECLVVVTGLPCSGTSMLMQMLAAGGLKVISGLDEAHGHAENELVRKLLEDSQWRLLARGKAIEISVPLLSALPQDLPCRVILMERDIEQILDFQVSLQPDDQPTALERRGLLRDEYFRTLAPAKAAMAKRANAQLLVVEYYEAITARLFTAEKVNNFLDGGLDTLKMAAAIDPGLRRNRAAGASV